MRGLEAGDVLEAWEAGRRRDPAGRSMLLLRAADSRSWEELRRLPIGERDRLILELRRRTLGARLDCFTECPECGGRLEFPVDAATLLAVGDGREESELRWSGGASLIKRATVGDLEDALLEASDEGAYFALLDRCVEASGEDGRRIAPAELPPEVRAEIAARMAEMDPAAETLLALTCPICETTWRQALDISAFFWTELVTQAKRLVREVHTLAAAYGWEEETILAMSAARRRLYIELLAERP